MFRASHSRFSQTLLVLLMPVAFLLAPIGTSPVAADVAPAPPSSTEARSAVA